VLGVDPYRYSAFVVDTTHQKAAEAALVVAAERERAARAEADAERARLRDLFEQAPALVAVLRGREGVCELFNARFRRMWGERDVVGLPMREAWPDLAGQGYFELVERVVDTGAVEVRSAFPAVADWDNDGTPTEAFFDFVYAPYRDAAGDVEGVMIVGFEVTGEVLARREAEQTILLRDEFLASASHDLKTPLTAILGRTQLLQRHLARSGPPDPKLASGLAAIREVAAQMAAQIDELQDVARLRTGQALDLNLAHVDLSEPVRAAADRLRDQATGHPLDVVAEPGLVAEVDPTRLGRVLDNLLGNAVKYSPAGSEVTLHLGRDGDEAVLTVRDRGIGIPAADLPRIFERYHRGANASRFVGAGIGLAGARRIVEQHGGAIAAESVEGEGSVFTVRLPLVR
jgi:signal transduction histidine kinase